MLPYVVGSAVVLLLALADSVTAGRDDARKAVAAVWDAAADLVSAPEDDATRHRLAAAWATANEAVTGYRLRPATGELAAAWAGARDAAAAAARIAARPSANDPGTRTDLAGRWRAAAAAVLRSAPVEGVGAPAPRTPPVLRSILEPAALWTGARIGVCVGVATTLAILLRTPAHAFWIPLTVAVVVRPEYGSVLVRSLHRLAGTLVGVVVVAVLLPLTSSPPWITAVAAVSLGLAAFGATRLYGLAVVGITGSALLSVALSTPAGFDPWARLVDTLLGCAIALVLGVLLWPRRGLPDQARTFARACAALADYAETGDHPETTDRAYLRAHAWRAQLELDLTEPDPAHTAAGWLPVAHRLEHLVDLVAAAGPRARTADVVTLLRARPRTPGEATALLASATECLAS